MMMNTLYIVYTVIKLCVPEIYMILSTNVTLIKNKQNSPGKQNSIIIVSKGKNRSIQNGKIVVIIEG